jgi:hypothetical protein
MLTQLLDADPQLEYLQILNEPDLARYLHTLGIFDVCLYVSILSAWFAYHLHAYVYS